MQLRRVQKVLEFEQELWMKSYIEINTEFCKLAPNDFKHNFCKLMNNSVFRKTMGNLRKHVEIKLVKSTDEAKMKD